ncbi:MAG: GMC family oxidoreductase [Saprospiraceae bacterium]|nr:GMC family oxidoreductase [Saprospiraceae bacterium]
MSKNQTYDAIIVGSGITGGWAAKELTEKGLKTLVLERGRDVKHVEDYPTAMMAPWQFKHRGYLTREEKEDYPIQSRKYNFDASSKHFFVKDVDHPYIQEKPFHWFRGYQTGGRSLLWGRGAYRFSDLEFEANAKDGVGSDWPIRYKDIAPWYDYVEKFIGVAGSLEGIWQFPDGQFLPPFDLNHAEKVIKERIESHYPDRKLIPNRVAHITQAEPGQFKGRGPCQGRNMCHRGCPYGAYFSTNSSTLPAAYETGLLTLQSHAVVESVIYDQQKDRATGVRVIDSQSGDTTEYFARVIFLCASTLASTAILLNSKTPRFSDGLANSSGVLGHYLMDHHGGISGSGTLEGFEDRIYKGTRPAMVAIPRFRNIKSQEMDFLRGYGVWGGASRGKLNGKRIGVGATLKEKLAHEYGPWRMTLGCQSETLPQYDNKMMLDEDKRDAFGLPMIRISATYGENERLMRIDIKEQIAEMLEVAGLKDIATSESKPVFGATVHEMGTARMGHDPKTSVLNAYNQCHDVPNLFVTDGSCMVSSGNVSTSLTYMALTARACKYAVDEMKKGNI